MADEQHQDEDDDDEGEEEDDAQRDRDGRVAAYPQRASEVGEARGEGPPRAQLAFFVGEWEGRIPRRDELPGAAEEIHGDGGGFRRGGRRRSVELTSTGVVWSCGGRMPVSLMQNGKPFAVCVSLCVAVCRWVARCGRRALVVGRWPSVVARCWSLGLSRGVVCCRAVQ